MVTERTDPDQPHRISTIAAAVLAGACLAFVLFALGFLACASPAVSETFAQWFADDANAPYPHEDLVDLAVATRDYTVDDFGRNTKGVQRAREDFCAIFSEAAHRASSEHSPVIGKWNESARKIAQDDSYGAASDQMFALANVSQTYALDENAIQHLDDCHALIAPAFAAVRFAAIIALCIIGNFVARGRRAMAGTILIVAPATLMALLAACGIWAVIDFNGFFSTFHAVLFPQGNWTFPADSLLICMLPLNFWVSMGALWLAVGLLACIIAMFIGTRLKHHRA